MFRASAGLASPNFTQASRLAFTAKSHRVPESSCSVFNASCSTSMRYFTAIWSIRGSYPSTNTFCSSRISFSRSSIRSSSNILLTANLCSLSFLSSSSLRRVDKTYRSLSTRSSGRAQGLTMIRARSSSESSPTTLSKLQITKKKDTFQVTLWQGVFTHCMYCIL